MLILQNVETLEVKLNVLLQQEEALSQRGTFMERNLYSNLHNLIKGKYAVCNGC